MKKLLAAGIAVILATVVLTGCGAKEDDGSNVVSQEPPKDAKLKPQSMGGPSNTNGEAPKVPSGSGQLPPPP